MNIRAAGERARIAMQGHVAVGNVVAQNEEPHGDVVARSCQGAAFFFAGEHLEIVDDAVRKRFAAVCAVAATDGESLVVQGRLFAHHLEDAVGIRQFAEGDVFAFWGGRVLYDMAGSHILENVVGVPGTLDYEVAVVLEPLDECLGFGADLVADTLNHLFVGRGGDDFQTFDGHKGYPCMRVFFHV